MSEKMPEEDSSDIYYNENKDNSESLVKILSDQVNTLMDEMKTLLQERETTHQKLLRISAEFENYQKRSKKEKLRWEKGVTRKILHSLLPAFDHLDTVMSHGNELPDTFKKGLQLIHEGFLKSLADYGVKCFVPEIGSDFDPEVHCAISIQHSVDAEQEVVGHVVRSGYVLGDSILRPADVIVHKKI